MNLKPTNYPSIYIPISILIALLLALYLWFNTSNSTKTATVGISQTPTPEATTDTLPVAFEASLEIRINGSKRNFSSPMYHNLSPDVYLQADDPNIIHVRKAGITWADFFATQPMKVDKRCLTAGSGQTFCTTATKKLRFYLNEVETPDLLDQLIMAGDKAKIVY